MRAWHVRLYQKGLPNMPMVFRTIAPQHCVAAIEAIAVLSKPTITAQSAEIFTHTMSALPQEIEHVR